MEIIPCWTLTARWRLDSGVRIIRPYQLVYGLQTGALIRATSEQREERSSDIGRCLKNFGNLGGAVGRASYSRDIFYFKSRM